MSKTPASKASAKKAASKPKTTAKAAPAKKAAAPAKAPAKTAAKPAAKAPAKAPVKAAAKTAAKAPAKAPVKTPIKSVPPPVRATPVAAAPAPVPAPPAPVSAAPAPLRRSSKTPAPPPVAAPLPPATSRFADRFAPPRPPTRQMNNLGLDTPKPMQKADPKLANAWKSKAGRDLSEAELLAMPESEYMNDKQLEFFRHKLQTLKDDLLSNAGETTEHLREDTSIVPDPADRATIEEEHALELRTRDRERKLLKKISQSLGRIDAGDYGFCDETGEPIGLGRLIARPTATLSLEAQQRRELKQKMFGD
ncbi:RNA polymerase-binding protein DksA [Piscinibacter sp.]|uniref:RNA polymerase-binding protein DksA n=1 Tax=Piscinibacter sp. TaxID=1903157 RepID=UPI0039E32AA9